ncbi:MAG: phosphotransferase [Legionellaceae bacterium]|nr:phosphotransferase [Legionellaceae bacterium]HAF86990.1 phosphotransferase [Legionellales bacterium]HCA89649.1 phosphotransferase [Legionellales bacterium]|tara:strand:- start:744 stop:1715 length:972 start_codon:yes stop_codon:yes gene_type:complete
MHFLKNALHQWLNQVLDEPPKKLIPLAGDASARQYYRLYLATHTLIVMDASADKASLPNFLNISHFLKGHAFCVPIVHAFSSEEGFILLEDFGDTLLLQQLTSHNVEPFYHNALAILIKLQRLQAPHELPVFDKAFMLEEMRLFTEWFLTHHLKFTVTPTMLTQLHKALFWLAETIANQPYALIHRDYHSRNLMVIADATPKLGIIDYQDAMLGPFAYDVVSLLKDCYIEWPCAKRHDWQAFFYQNSDIAQQVMSFDDFNRAVDLCGIQRHLKVLGIFARLHLRDKKSHYLAYLPRTLNYILECISQFPELSALQIMLNRVAL